MVFFALIMNEFAVRKLIRFADNSVRSFAGPTYLVHILEICMHKEISYCKLTFYYNSNSVAYQHLNWSISNINNNGKIPLGIS